MISTSVRKVQYALSASPPSTFSIPFKFFDETEIKALLTLSTGATSLLTYGVDYSISTPSDSGTLTRLTTWNALAIRVTIYREVDQVQATDLRNGATTDAEVVEESLDLQVAMIQELAEESGRSIRLPIDDTAGDMELPNASTRALKLLAFDAAGDPVAADGSGTPTSAFMANALLSDSGEEFASAINLDRAVSTPLAPYLTRFFTATDVVVGSDTYKDVATTNASTVETSITLAAGSSGIYQAFATWILAALGSVIQLSAEAKATLRGFMRADEAVHEHALKITVYRRTAGGVVSQIGETITPIQLLATGTDYAFEITFPLSTIGQLQLAATDRLLIKVSAAGGTDSVAFTLKLLGLTNATAIMIPDISAKMRAAEISYPGAGVPTGLAALEAKSAIDELYAMGIGKNKFINGDLRIDQRNAGASKSFPLGYSGRGYGVDRWYVQCATVACTGQRVAGDIGIYGYKVTGATSNADMRFGQIIEALNSAPLKSKNCTVSFVAKADSVRTLTYKVNRANAVDDWTAVTELASGTIDLSTTATAYVFNFAAGALAGNGIQVELRAASGLPSGAWMQFERLQLEEGLHATSFEHRLFSHELALCQRYYEKSFAVEVAPVNGGAGSFADSTNTISMILVQSAAGNRSSHYPYKVPKRVVGYPVAYGNSSSQWGRNSNNSTDGFTAPSLSGNLNGFYSTVAISANVVSVMEGHFTTDSEF